MALHRLTRITVGVPDVDAAAAFYRDFGLDDLGDGRFATTDGGEQLRLVPADRRGLQELGLGADDPDDLDRIARSLAAIGAASERAGDVLRTIDPTTGTAITVTVAARVEMTPTVAPVFNAPGRTERTGERADAVLRDAPVRPPPLPRRARFARRRRDASVLHRGPGLQGERSHPRCRRVSAVLDRPPQPARARRARHVPAPHVVDGRRRRRGRPRLVLAWWPPIPPGTCGVSAAITSARTSSGTCATRPATSPSTPATSTSSSTTSCGSPRTSPTCARSCRGVRRSRVVHRARRSRRAHGHGLAVSELLDAIVVGYGPVGAVAAGLLGQAGLRTAVFESTTSVYHLPRAAHLDAEIMRVLHQLDVSRPGASRVRAGQGHALRQRGG